MEVEPAYEYEAPMFVDFMTLPQDDTGIDLWFGACACDVPRNPLSFPSPHFPHLSDESVPPPPDLASLALGS